MKQLVQISTFLLLFISAWSCSKRENYIEGPSILDIIEEVKINNKPASIDHLSGLIQVSLPGNTDLRNVTYVATAPAGVTISPAGGTPLNLEQPVTVTADNGFSRRIYRIVATLLPSKIACLGDGATIAQISDDDVQEAAEWAQQTYGDDFVYIPYAELDDEALLGVNVIFYMHDQVGSSAQPAALLEKLNVLSKFYVQGGKILAGQHGTGIVEELGRDRSGLRTIIGTGAGGPNADTWAVGFTNSPIANILTNGVAFNANGQVNVIDGGFKEDHNSMWTMDPLAAPKYGSFSTLYNAEVLATWDWNVASQGTGGIILWNPSGRFRGTIITLGVGGMEWRMNDGRPNAYAQNIRTIYKNAIDYLKGL
ncbi:MAG TPA: DUF4960 domain-containing protein [Saprospiraceae bacterium]|nr:DUF4960 domain-containing protein [Saprospiraceae bacterium]HRK80036.1 DUF4960 domain-containing protein [Saprospiraceae bacterium]